jgi:hypothetical protein
MDGRNAGMTQKDIGVVDVSSRWNVKLPVEMPLDIVHWLREHSVRDLKKLLLEMHSAGEDITEYVPVLEELEAEEKKLKFSGDLKARDGELDVLEYIDEEMREALA